MRVYTYLLNTLNQKVNFSLLVIQQQFIILKNPLENCRRNSIFHQNRCKWTTNLHFFQIIFHFDQIFYFLIFDFLVVFQLKKIILSLKETIMIFYDNVLQFVL